jgi:tetratricopeptide (TPR) repeat protein
LKGHSVNQEFRNCETHRAAFLPRLNHSFFGLDALTPLGLDAREELAVSLNNLAVLYHAQASYREAEPLFLRALPLLNPETGWIWNNVAEFYAAEGKYGEAETAGRRPLEIHEKMAGPQSPGAVMALRTLAFVCMNLQRLDESLVLLERAREIREKT